MVKNGGRPVGEGCLQDRLHLGIEKGLAAGEVELPDTKLGTLLQVGKNPGQRHHLVGVVGGGAGDEAVGAGQVADGAADLKPESVEVAELDHRRRGTSPA